MSETEADRMLRARAKKAQQDTAEAARHAHKANCQALERATWQSEADIPIVLSLLAGQGYPDIKELNLPREGSGLLSWLTGGHRQIANIKAAWQIGTYTYTSYGDEMTGNIYLLSDGRLYTDYNRFITSPMSPRQYADQVLRLGVPQNWLDIAVAVAAGLRRLREKLEG